MYNLLFGHVGEAVIASPEQEMAKGAASGLVYTPPPSSSSSHDGPGGPDVVALLVEPVWQGAADELRELRVDSGS